MALFPCGVTEDGVGDRLAVLHCHLGEFQLLLAILVDEIADDEDDELELLLPGLLDG